MVNCANIDWFFPWPEQALYAVASVFISPDVSILGSVGDSRMGGLCPKITHGTDVPLG